MEAAAVTNHDHLAIRAASFAVRGRDVEIVGDRGAGRTDCLLRVDAALVERGWETLVIRGEASFRTTPYAALTLAGIGSTRDQRGGGLGSLVDELTDMLKRGRTALLVDDWDDLDDASWGAVSVACERAHAPVVLTRIRGAKAGSTRPSSRLRGSMRVTLAPLPYAEFERALAEHVSERFEASTMSQLFALAGGHVGLGLAIYDAAAVEKKIELVDGQWVAVGDLWCDSLTRMVEAILDPLGAPLVEALEILAFVGTVDIDAMRPVVGNEALEELEAQGLVTVLGSGSSVLVSVAPPLVVEYFRSSSRTIRRGRLLEKVESLRHSGEVDTHPWTPDDPDAHTSHFVRVIHERLSARQLVAKSEWERKPNLSAAVAYLEASIRMPLPDAVVDRVFAETAGAPGDELSKADWLVLRAEHRAFHHGEAVEAIARLRAEADDLPRYGGLLTAKAVELEHIFVGDADISALAIAADEGLPRAVRARTHLTHAYLLTSRGEWEESDGHLDAAAQLMPTEGVFAEVVRGFNHLLAGRLNEAILLASRGFDIARAQLDPERMRGLGNLYCVCKAFAGQYRDIDAVVEQVMALGDPVSVPPFADRDVAIIASVVASRRGQSKLAERRLRDAERAGIPDNPLLGGNVSWARAQILAANGSLGEAADLLSADGDSAWRRGSRAAAALAYLAAVEIDPNEERLASKRARIADVPAPVVVEQLAFAEALVARNAAQLGRLASQFEAGQRFSLALLSLRHASDFFTEDGQQADAAASIGELQAMQARMQHLRVDHARFVVHHVELTAREEQVARLAAAKRTNQQIADELVLSPRTVESHVHRAMRKVGVQRRADLAAYFEGVDARR